MQKAPLPRFKPAILLAAALVAALPVSSFAASLNPSRGSLDRQNRAARQHDFTFLRNRVHVDRFVQRGWLVRVPSSTRDYRLKDVSFPYARPEVKLFIQRLASQYRAACGERLVVTSLTRPHTHQPWNASSKSVHPTGMALDLRRSRSRNCRRWIEKTLLYLEQRDVLEASRERWPPHYHIALFPKPYKRYVENKLARASGTATHRVKSGESLWTIARRYDTSVSRIKRENGMRSNTIHPGQRLKIPQR